MIGFKTKFSCNQIEIRITVPRVSEKIMAVSLFLTLWAIKFLTISVFMLPFSQNSNTLHSSSCRKPYKLEARSVSPVSRPSNINKKMFNINLKLDEIKARGNT